MSAHEQKTTRGERPMSEGRKVTTGAVIGVGLALVVTAALLGAFGDGATAPDDRKTDTARGDRAAGAPAWSTLPAADWAGRYALELRQDYRGRIGDGHVALSASLEAVVEIAAYEGDGEPGWLAARMVEPAVRLEASKPSALDPRLGDAESLTAGMGFDPDDPTRGFDRPFLIRLRPDGQVTALRFAPETPAVAQRVLADVAAALQVVRDETAGPASRWTVEEEGPDGPFVATYAWDPAGAELQKTWNAEQPDVPSHVTAAAQTTLRVTDGALQRAHHTYDVHADFSFTSAYALVHTLAFELRVERMGTPSGRELAWTRTMDPSGLSPFEAGAVATAAAADWNAAAGTAKRSVDELLSAGGVSRAAGDHGAWLAAAEELSAHVRKDNRVADGLRDRIARATPFELDVSTEIKALELAETPYAHARLGSLLGDDRVPEETRRAVATVVAFARAPSDVLIEDLRTASWGAGRDGGNTAALYSLATHAYFQRKSGTTSGVEHSVELGGELRVRAADALGSGDGGSERLRPAGAPAPSAEPTSEREILMWLDVLGNLGGPEIFEFVAPLLEHDNPKIRREAVDALRFVPTIDARQAIVLAMATDPHEDVRWSAVSSARYQPRAAMEEHVVRVLHQDRAKAVRHKAALAIATWGLDAPALYQHLLDARDREPDPFLRQAYLDLQPTVHLDEAGESDPFDETEGEIVIVPNGTVTGALDGIVTAPLAPTAGGGGE